MKLAEAIGWLQARCAARSPETVPLRLAAGRVLAADAVLARSPAHATAAIDGVAVLAAAVEGASDYAPVPVAGVVVRAGDAMPAGADAVLPPHGVEDGAALMAVGRGAGVHPPGHDVMEGAVLPAGTVLTALHLALLRGDPMVRPLARVALADPRLSGRFLDLETIGYKKAVIPGLVPGTHAVPSQPANPLIHPTSQPDSSRSLCGVGGRDKPGHDDLLGSDMKSIPGSRAPDFVSLLALVAAAGAVVTADEPDLVLLAERSGGGAGWVAQAEGIAMQPGEATAIGLFGGAPAIVLPRHAADAATVFALLAAPVLRRIGGLPEPQPVPGTLTRKITSSLGMLEAVRVRVAGGRATPLGPAEGIGLLAAAAANGLVLVPEGSEGYPAGAMVPIYPL
jgi:molybdopterin biosynthesis enzyme